ncbi:acyl-CoA dehydrogenase family protein [Euzebya sp.]|uniref:acyl-CoA dehydrogenase family protein n=1 Tax=Euzebya sp. TaxID=1971409 RepID=UPI003515C6BD
MAGDTHDELRSRIRAWCAEHVPRDWRRTQAGVSRDDYVAFQQDWLARLEAGGWAVPHWPAAWGGGYSPAEQAVIFSELARADAPRLSLHFISLHHAAATLLHGGSGELQERHLPAIRAGEVWCQGFSEPGAGSDLASLRTRAERHGDVYVVNGQKTWASMAMYADWCLLLVRTDPDAPTRHGITYLVMDMRADGVEVRPIRQATGEEHFCEVYLDDVEVPVANRIGPEDEGWRVAQTTLNSERAATMVELAERLALGYGWLVDLARSSPMPGGGLPGGGSQGGGSLLDDALVRDRLGGFAAEVESLRLLVGRAVSDDLTDAQAGALASIVKLTYSELLQRLMDFGTSVAGLGAHLETDRPASGGWESGAWLLDFIASWEWTIPGGTSEIQRTIIGERALGLPREPRAA